MVDQVSIFDLMGKQVFSSKSNVTTNTLIPVQFNTTGIYLVKLTIDNQVMTYKVLAGN
jgi:hypothetical protein